MFNWKRIEKRDLLLALLIGAFCACGLFLSLTAEATPDNSPALLEDEENLLLYNNEAMIFVRSLYLSFSSARLKTGMALVVVAAIVYISRRIYATWQQKITFALLSMLFAAGQMVAICYKTVESWTLFMETPLNQARVYLKGASYALICYFILRILYQFMLDATQREVSDVPAVRRRDVLVMMGCMLLCWLPYFIIFYPGTSNEDTSIQIMQYFEIPSYIQKMTAVQGDDIFITNHHPYILTVVFSLFVKLGLYLGDARLGVAIYTLLHMIFLSGVYGGCLQYLRICGVGERRVRFLLGMLMLFPIFPLYSICMLKDTLYAAFCLIYIMMMHCVGRTKGEILSSVPFHIGMFVTGLLMMLTKVYGMYILLIVGVVYLCKYRRHYKGILLSVFLPVFLYKVLYIGMLLPALNVAPGGVQEALSVPFQQTARYVTEYGDEVTDKEREAINRILPYKKLAKAYKPELSDPVKIKYKQDATREDLKDYFKVWFQMFRKHPEVYVEATLHNTYQYYDIDKISELEYYQFDQYLIEHDDEKEYEWLYVTNLGVFTTTRYVIKQFVMFLEKVPIVNIPISMGFFPWILLFFLLYNLFRKRGEMNFALLIPLITYAVCMVSPDNGNSRYIMPVIFSLPYLFLLELTPGRAEPVHDGREGGVENGLEADEGNGGV